MNSDHPDAAHECGNDCRRSFMKSIAPLGLAGLLGLTGSPSVEARSRGRHNLDDLSPQQILAEIMRGNAYFRRNKSYAYTFHREAALASSETQTPGAAFLSCIDSRAPAEIVTELAPGEAFNARVAGNVSSDDILGSLEFACSASTAKVLMVMGHTRCGAVKGAIDNVQMGHLTQLLDKIKPAIAATEYSGERTGSNYDFVDAVAKTNVKMVIDEIKRQSPILEGRVRDGKLLMVGGMYNVSTLKLTLL